MLQAVDYKLRFGELGLLVFLSGTTILVDHSEAWERSISDKSVRAGTIIHVNLANSQDTSALSYVAER